MNALKKILTSRLFLTLIGLLGCYALAGFFLLPYLVRHYGPRIILEQTKKQATVGRVRINPFLFTFEVKDFKVAETGGERIVGFQRFFCDFELASIVERAWTFSRIDLTAPLLNAVVAADGTINLARLVPPSTSPVAPEEKKALPRLIVKAIAIDQAQIDFVDQRPSKPAVIHYQPLQLAIHNLTTLPGQEGQVVLTAKGSDGQSLRLDGQLGLEPLRARGSVAVESLPLATLFQFVRDSLALAPPEGKVALQAQYRVEAGADGGRAMLSGLEVAVDGLAVKLDDAEDSLFALTRLRLGGGMLDLARHRVEVKSIVASGGRARLAMDENGLLNAGRMAKAAAAVKAEEAPATGKGTPWKVAVGGFAVNDLSVEYRDQSRTPEVGAAIGTIQAEGKAEAEVLGGELRGAISDIDIRVADVQAALANQEQPLLRIGKIGLDGGKLDLASKDFVADKVAVQGGGIDLVRQADGAINLTQLAPTRHKAREASEKEDDAAPPARFLVKTVALSGIDVAVSDLALKAKSPALNLQGIALSLSEVDGKSPMKFELALKVKEGGQLKSAGTINPALPSVEAKVQVEALNLLPAQPYLSRLAAITLKSGTISSQGNLRFGCDSAAAECRTYQGGVAIDGFRLTAEGGEETLVGWRSLQTEQLKLDLKSNALEIGDLKIAEPSGKVVIDKDHSLNLAKLIKKPAQSAPKPTAVKPESAAPVNYRVRRILVKKGKVDFADFSLLTPFGTKIHELQGTVTSISSQKGARAQVKLEGFVDDYGTANVKGELDTSDPKAFTDINLTFRNVEMARLTPYSGKFAGRQIKSGKLSVDLQYKINAGELAGDNQFKVERLTLGERVDSPEAVNLPLDLAIALLEDSKGVIDLGLPVRGNLNSPEFSYGAIVGKALASMLLKIVTSPFRILGALLPGFGEGATLNAVAFEAGRTDIPPPEREKLAKLAEALQKRPQLKLTVTGVYHPASDKAVLQTRHVSRALAKVLRQETEAEADVDAFDFASSETEEALVGLFKERFGAEAYKSVKAEDKAARKAEKEKAKASAGTGKGRAEEDPGRLAKLLFVRLGQGEKIADTELAKLADDRAQAVIGELATTGKIPQGRLAIRPAKGVDSNSPIAAELNLEAGP